MKVGRKPALIFLIIVIIISLVILASYYLKDDDPSGSGCYYMGPAVRIEYDLDSINHTQLYHFFQNETYNRTFILDEWHVNETVFTLGIFHLYNNYTDAPMAAEGWIRENCDSWADTIEYHKANRTYQKELVLFTPHSERFIDAFASEFGEPNKVKYYMKYYCQQVDP